MPIPMPVAVLDRQYRLSPEVSVGIRYQEGCIRPALLYGDTLYDLESATRDETLISYCFCSGLVLNIYCGHTTIGYSLEGSELLLIGALRPDVDLPKLSVELDWIGEALLRIDKEQ